VDDPSFLLEFANRTMWITALVAAPILLSSLAVGLIVGMIQAATSVNEQTLTFVPKLAVTAFLLMLLGGSMMTLMTDFTQDLFAMIPELTR
jgi:flagellar biosynthesis protein FliQ